MDKQLSYSDSLVEVSEAGIQFRTYYFPTGAKFVKFSDILRFEKRPLTLRNGKYRFWGTGDFRAWFPMDLSRSRRSCIFFHAAGYSENSNRFHR